MLALCQVGKFFFSNVHKGEFESNLGIADLGLQARIHYKQLAENLVTHFQLINHFQPRAKTNGIQIG